MRPTLLGLALLGAVAAAPVLAQPSPAPMPGRAPGAGLEVSPGTAPTAVPVAPTAVPITPVPDRSGATTPNQGAERGAPAGTPVAGANSFTEGQARSRMEAAGFTGIGELEKDDQGIWRGRGTRAGQPVTVMLDYQGTVTSR